MSFAWVATIMLSPISPIFRPFSLLRDCADANSEKAVPANIIAVAKPSALAIWFTGLECIVCSPACSRRVVAGALKAS
jgi:hypothetical protein